MLYDEKRIHIFVLFSIFVFLSERIVLHLVKRLNYLCYLFQPPVKVAGFYEISFPWLHKLDAPRGNLLTGQLEGNK